MFGLWENFRIKSRRIFLLSDNFIPKDKLQNLPLKPKGAEMKETNSQSTLLRGLVILEKIVESDKALSSAYLAEDLDLPKATVHRICQQLEEAGMLKREPGGKKFIGGSRLSSIAKKTLSNSILSSHRSAILRDLSNEVNETCNLTILDGHEIVYLERVEANWPYRIHLPVGSHLPLHCTATGKLFLANMKPNLRDKILKTIPLSKHTDLTITNMSELKNELEKIADEGVGIDNGEYLDGMVAIAAPVINKENSMNFALAIHAPSSRKTIDELRQYLPVLRKAAAKMAEAENLSA